jgi:hypothetical protein
VTVTVSQIRHRSGVIAAYLLVAVLVAAGVLPIWCFAVVLTVPMTLRPVDGAAGVGAERRGGRMLAWAPAFVWQLVIGYAIAHIVR